MTLSLSLSHTYIQTVPGPPNVTNLLEENIGSFTTVLTWEPPDEPNGIIIAYVIRLTVQDTDVILKSRKRRQNNLVRGECVIGGFDRNITVPGSETSLNVTLSK